MIKYKSVKESLNQYNKWKENHPYLYQLREIYYEIFYRFPNNIKLFFKEIKWSIQRSKRGYSDCDVWNFYDYHSELCKNALLHLRHNLHGHPCDITFEEWKNIIDQMIYAFDQAEKISYDLIMWGPGRKENIKDLKFQTREEYRKMQKGFKLFFQYYWHLWD